MKIPAALGVMASITGLATYIYYNDSIDYINDHFLTSNQKDQLFNEWIAEHGRSYGTKGEYKFRF